MTLHKIGLFMAFALVICLFPLPYGYYTLMRFAAMVYFGCLAYAYHANGKTAFAVITGAIALLFQPFIKITLGREVWGLVDVAVAIGLVIIWYRSRKSADNG